MGKRVSKLEKQSLLEDFEKSGLKQYEYAKFNNLNKKTLSRWINEFKRKQGNQLVNKDSKSLFQPIFI